VRAKGGVELSNSSHASLLREIVLNTMYKKWSRIAAAYALGFLGDRSSVGTLLLILEDMSEQLQLRTHAAEALGNLKDPRAVRALERTFMKEKEASVKRWCVYALAEIGTPQAYRSLLRLEAKRPTGGVAKELRSALIRLRGESRSS
jgi:HEAT repeat protein